MVSEQSFFGSKFSEFPWSVFGRLVGPESKGQSVSRSVSRSVGQSVNKLLSDSQSSRQQSVFFSVSESAAHHVCEPASQSVVAYSNHYCYCYSLTSFVSLLVNP